MRDNPKSASRTPGTWPESLCEREIALEFRIIGDVLSWHKQYPAWVYTFGGWDGSDSQPSGSTSPGKKRELGLTAKKGTVHAERRFSA